MKILKKIIFGKNSDINRRSFVLNSVAGITSALKAVLILMIVMRITNVEDAGIITIAFAISNLLMTIGKFGVRNYQVTDVAFQYSFKSYLFVRIFTSIVMLIATIFYCLYNFCVSHDSGYKICIIAIICMMCIVEAIEDVFCGVYQQKGRLDVASIIFLIRWVLIILIFSVILFITRNTLVALLYAFVFSTLADIIMIKISFKELNLVLKDMTSSRYKEINLIKNCFPLFAGAFLMIYISNSPKYAIEMCLSDEIQAYYGFVSMPIFVIELLNNFLYQPILTNIAGCWNNGEIRKFRKYIITQCLLLTGITIVCIVGAYFLGIPVLSMIYNTNLTSYKIVLLLVLLGGGFLAFTGFFAVLLTIMRKQHWMMYSYVVIAISALLTMVPCVKKYGVFGGSVLFVVLIMLLSILLLICVLVGCKKIEGRIKA